MKICEKCKINKPLTDFGNYKVKSGVATRSSCKSCHSLAEKNRDKSHRVTVTYKYKRNKRLLWKYGISSEDFDAMALSQDMKCAICKNHDSWNRRDTVLVVDHDHATGKVRGLLCHYCNSLLGHARDSVQNLENAINYLTKQEEEIDSKD